MAFLFLPCFVQGIRRLSLKTGQSET